MDQVFLENYNKKLKIYLVFKTKKAGSIEDENEDETVQNPKNETNSKNAKFHSSNNQVTFVEKF